MPDADTRRRTAIGVILALTTATAFAISNALANVVFIDGGGELELLIVRWFASAVVLLIYMRASGVSPGLPAGRLVAALGLGVIAVGYAFALLRSFSFVPIALAVLVFYLFPIVTTLAAWSLGRERPSWRVGAVIVIAFGGLVLALDVTGATVNLAGIALAFAAAVGVAIAVLGIDTLVGHGGDARPVMFWMTGASIVLCAAIIATNLPAAFPATTTGWAAFVGSTVIFIYAYIGFFVAVTLIGPVRLTVLANIEPVVTLPLGFFILGQLLSPIQLVGGAIVVGALLLLHRR